MSDDPLDPDGTLVPNYVTLPALRASHRPMTVLERVERHALGMEDMSSTELVAAKLFLAKTQADLKAVELSGPDGGAIPISWPIPKTNLDK
jgi:hypothetical protein